MEGVMADEVEVTQADREAARGLFNTMLRMGPIIDQGGRELGRAFLHAFARHRIAHQGADRGEG